MKKWAIGISVGLYLLLNSLIVAASLSPPSAWWEPLLLGNLILVSICFLLSLCIVIAEIITDEVDI